MIDNPAHACQPADQEPFNELIGVIQADLRGQVFYEPVLAHRKKIRCHKKAVKIFNSPYKSYLVKISLFDAYFQYNRPLINP